MVQAIELLDYIKAGNIAPVYVLSGDEPFYIDLISDYIEKEILTEEEKGFNQTVLYGKEAVPSQVVESARRFPMMAEKQVIILKEAKHISNFTEFEAYFKNPTPSTILVIALKNKSFDKRTAAYKAAKANKEVVLLETKKLYDNQLPEWISSFAKMEGFKISPKASMMISDHLGNDLARIGNEIQKLKINLKEGAEINDEIVDKYIGISKDYNVFELNSALNAGDHARAQKIAYYFDKNPKQHPLVVTIGTLYGNFSKLLAIHYLKDKHPGHVAKTLKVNPYFAKDYINASHRFKPNKLVGIISMLREYDLKSKGVGNSDASDGELLKELCFRILN